jgi:hypothetical protein
MPTYVLALELEAAPPRLETGADRRTHDRHWRVACAFDRVRLGGQIRADES